MADRIPVKILLTDENAVVPAYKKDGDAGADVYSVQEILVEAGRTAVVDLGLRIQLPPGWEMQVRSRSGLSKKGITVANAPGTIDSGYRGPCMVLLHNQSGEDYQVNVGDRIAQFVLKRAPQAEFTQVLTLDASERGEGGFGSTGA